MESAAPSSSRTTQPHIARSPLADQRALCVVWGTPSDCPLTVGISSSLSLPSVAAFLKRSLPKSYRLCTFTTIASLHAPKEREIDGVALPIAELAAAPEALRTRLYGGLSNRRFAVVPLSACGVRSTTDRSWETTISRPYGDVGVPLLPSA